MATEKSAENLFYASDVPLLCLDCARLCLVLCFCYASAVPLLCLDCHSFFLARRLSQRSFRKNPLFEIQKARSQAASGILGHAALALVLVSRLQDVTALA